MRVINKKIKRLSSILIFSVLLVLIWFSTNRHGDNFEENLIAEYLQKENAEKENEESLSSDETSPTGEEKPQEESGNEAKKNPEKAAQKSGIESSTVQENKSSQKTDESSPQNNISSSSTAQINSSAPADAQEEKASDQKSNQQQTTSQINYIHEVVKLCNKARENAGIGALQSQNTKLQKAADVRALEIKQNFSHTRPNGTSAYTVLKEEGISHTVWGENIAYGQRTPQEVFDAWMNSPGHRANILNANFKEIAVGMNNYYWVQIFI